MVASTGSFWVLVTIPKETARQYFCSPEQAILDRESLDLGNDLVVDPALGQCPHGKPWNLCEMADCAAIWLLLQEQRKEWGKDERDRRDYKLVEKQRGRKSEYEIALEQKDKQRVITDDYENLAAFNVNHLPDPTPPHSRKLLQNIFPDPITLQAALQFKAVTPRQARY